MTKETDLVKSIDQLLKDQQTWNKKITLVRMILQVIGKHTKSWHEESSHDETADLNQSIGATVMNSAVQTAMWSADAMEHLVPDIDVFVDVGTIAD
jgi:hypothetical protein